MKKKYQEPEMEVLEFSCVTAMLIGSPPGIIDSEPEHGQIGEGTEGGEGD